MTLRDFPARVKVLKDEANLRILCLLRNHAMCACDLASATDLAPIVLSEHLRALDRAGVIESKTDAARRRCFRIVRRGREPLDAVIWKLADLFWNDPQIREDRSQLALRRLTGATVACGAAFTDGDESQACGLQADSDGR